MDWVTAASSLLGFLLYYNTLESGFVYDDRRAILSNPDVIGHTPIKALFENDFWGTPLPDPGSHGSYRPLCVATYRLNYAFSGFKPWSYHFLNIIFHCTATALVVTTAKRLLPAYCMRVGTAVAGLSFAAHPIHTEAVAGVVGRADLAACNLFLLSFLLYSEHMRLREALHKKQRQSVKDSSIRRPITTSDTTFRLSCHGLVQQIMMNFRRLLKASTGGPFKFFDDFEIKTGPIRPSMCSDSASEQSGETLQWLTLAGTLLFAAAATLCKEPAIMVLPLCIFYDFLKGTRRENTYSKSRWRSVCALSTGGITLLYWRLRLVGSLTTFATADNPASRDPSIFTRFYTFAYLPVFNFCLLLYPFHLSFDWSMDAIPRITTILDSRNISTIIFYAVISKVTWRALVNEFRRPQESFIKESKYYKKQNSKTKHKWNNNCKQYNRGQDCVERKSYHTPHKENVSSKKLFCPCTGCKHSLADEHTSVCRASNNNNIIMHNSNCICPASNAKTTKTQIVRRNVYRSPRVALLMFTAFMALPFVPATNILFYVGFVVAERVLYIPSVGFCLLLGLGAGMLTRNWDRSDKRSRVFMLSLLLTLCAMCGYTLRRNLDWRDEESLFQSALHINPPKAYGNLGSVLTTQGRTAEAEVAFQKALKYRPNMADVHYNLGILLQNQRRYSEAIESFERAIYFRPSMARVWIDVGSHKTKIGGDRDATITGGGLRILQQRNVIVQNIRFYNAISYAPVAFVNLGTSLMADGRLAEAASALRAGARADGVRVRDRREHDAAKVSALVQLAALHSRRGHWHKALSAYKEALQMLPDSNAPIVGWTRHNVLSMASEIYVQLQQWPMAEHSILAALDVAPHHVPTHITLAQIVARNASRSSEAERWFKKALLIAPNDPSVRDQFGMFLRSQRRLRESAEQLVAAAKLMPNDGARAAAAARALRDARRCRSAERWYARAVELNLNDAEYHSNYGAILHLNGKYTAAATSYRRALKLQPNDEITITNLKRVRAIMTQRKR